MTILGAHMSIAGGYYKAVLAAEESECDCVQIFTKNNSRWAAKEISDAEQQAFADALDASAVGYPLSHSSYLINLATPDKALWKKSVDAFVIELQRAHRLGVPYVVLHPGSFTTSSEELGIATIIRALNEVHRQTKDLDANCLLETTAGQGSNLGWRFEQLAQMMDGVKDPDRLGICFDTCHVFAAGYPLGTEKEYKATMREFNKTIGVKQIKAFHLNDSKREFGSRKDRHENIGKGYLGESAFANLLSDRRFRRVPMYLETPKGQHKGKEWDVINLRLLRKLAAS